MAVPDLARCDDLVARVVEGRDAALEIVGVFGLHVLVDGSLPQLAQGRFQRPRLTTLPVELRREQDRSRQMVDPEDVYRRTTPSSRKLHERAVNAMPGGTTRTTTYFDPYPLYIERGEGCRIWDADGTERIDFLGNYTAMILGHAHPKVVEAIRRQAARGTGFAAANPIEVGLATLLCELLPSLDAVRFCNSGTEATMFAMRLPRAVSGRPKIARMEGGYHGTHDYAEVSTHPLVSEAGPPEAPIPRPDSMGTPDWVLEQTVVLPFNRPDAAEE